MRKVILFLGLFLLIGQVGFGQVRIDGMTDEDIKVFEKLAIKNIEELGKRIKKISKVKNKKIRDRIIEGQLRHFIPDAKIQIGNKKNGKLNVTEKTVRSYLYTTINNYQRKYDIVEIDFVSIDLKDLKPVPKEKNRYYFDYTVKQKFSVKRKSKITNKNKEDLSPKEKRYDYQDITIKQGRIYVEKRNNITGTKWKLLFGDIHVEDVTVL